MQSKQTANILTRKQAAHSGFTIVELLIVIVVIGILAAITIVAYNGITLRARTASLQTDMKNSANLLANDNTVNNAYPASIAAANNGQGLKASPGTTYQYAYNSSTNTYCLIGTNGTISYFSTTANPTPQSGTCFAQLNGVVTTLAGSTQGYTDGTGTAAQFQNPAGVAVDSSGTVYVADQVNNRIRKVTPAGVVTTLAGSSLGYTDGTGAAAQFQYPTSVALDSSGTAYVTDKGNNRIRKVTPAGVVTTLAGSGVAGNTDGSGVAAQFNGPSGVTVDSSGTVYVADTNNNRIRAITPSGVVTTLAGAGPQSFADGTGTAAMFFLPYGVTVDSSGTVYVADYGNNRIRKITPAGVVTTLAGAVSGSADGTGAAAQFNGPTGVAVDSFGTVYVGDNFNNRVRKITPAGVVTTLAGSGVSGSADGTGTAAMFNTAFGVGVDSSGTLYVADSNNARIRKIQ